MASASVTYTFTANTTILSSQVNQNFTDLVNFLNNSVAHLDASKPFTGIPTLPSANPESDNQASRKAYVDAQRDTRMRFGGGSSPALGTMPAAGTTVQVMCGVNSGMTDGSGDLTINFPSTVSSVLSAQVVALEGGGMGADVFLKLDAKVRAVTTTGFKARCVDNSTAGGSIATTLVQVAWVAVVVV